ncbi:G-protein coupled receptor 84-like [Perca fluviatilis]|uniref:G-protein coupled receptor 84-like n=1 Tax=Perca fluviatilis TaxID=8168 RepID=UPI0019629336|nr:G-protein coupled receptor 84-like [Perca fluviatilis]
MYEIILLVCTCSFHRTRVCHYFFVGLGCVGVFYFLIYRRVRIAAQALLRYRFSRRSSRKKPASSAQGTDDSGVESGTAKTCSCEVSSQMDLTQSMDEITCEKSSKSAQTSAKALNSSATNFPPEIVPTSPSTTPATSLQTNITVPEQVLHMFCANLTWLNSCINPMLYAVMNRLLHHSPASGPGGHH